MAAARTQSTAFTVQGLVFDEITRRGIEGLLVTAYDLGPTPDHEAGSLTELLNGSARLGSVLSDDSGRFSLEYDEGDFIHGDTGKRRPHLMVVVSAPDDENGSEKTLYVSKPPRLHAGRTEHFTIAISRETQDRFRLNGTAAVGDVVAAYERLRGDEQKLATGVVKVHQESIKQDIEAKAKLRETLLKSIATSPDALGTTGELVKDGDAIKDKVTRVGTKAVARANQTINDGRGVAVNLYLTADDRTRLQPFFDAATNGIAVIPEHELGDILFRTKSSENPGTLLVHRNPIAKFCAEQTFEEECAATHTGLEGGSGHDEGHEEGENGESSGGGTGGGSGNGSTPMANADVAVHANRLISTAPSPDAVLRPGFDDQRGDREAVEDAVDDFSLRKGPAEVPAFYDFHTLQIAFEHVWKVLLDEELVNKANSLNQRYKKKTGIGLADRFPFEWPILVVDGVYESVPQEVPANVAAQFDITLEEWTDLSAAHQAKVAELANAIATACNPVEFDFGIFGGSRRPAECEKRRQDLREQGERLIDAVRHDDYYTLHKTLRDLHDRINSNYEFTVFAADRNFHSVNFGLLNTYRQQWIPINYQAGKLVKTIPLSPKEERKYSVKVARNLKQAHKEALKNNAARKAEQSSTARVEAEIVEKAQNKTNFSLSADGSYNIGISKGKSTTTFGVEAAQESAESRKDFREALLKVVQEYNEERSVQIDTEESSAWEYNESGTIVNPNDELSVTYLFYELQRRYRVSEQLYRAVPVVLVAQPVPAPHEITEAWVIAHDWIINRYLLDDSFRPALQYLADKSVGDDFALRELRRNLRQQRNLVETLRIELASAIGEAENRYRGLERAIEKRIGEEESEETDSWFSDVGDFFGGDGQSPEAAKARELAAKDAHQYAVEKMEKAATAMRQEVGNLHVLTEQYNQTLRDHLDNETRVKRLLVHIRNNIFHYMQGIWTMEPPDQRFLRLHKVEVPKVELAEIPDPSGSGTTIPAREYRVEVTPSDDIFESFREPGTTKHGAVMVGALAPITAYRPLVEVADLDSLLGFKGNYMVFPLKEHNALTEFMTGPFVDAAFGAMDPDELNNVNLSDYSDYVCCLHNELSPADFAAIQPQLKKWLELLLADPLRNGDEIVVPTNSLFIEMLPGERPLLENFKLRHRELDVYKMQGEVRKLELENLRLAARLVNDEREDPDVDKKVLIEGSTGIVIDTDE